MLLDVGAKRGDVVKRFLQKEPQSSKYIIHAFETNPAYAGSLRSLMRKQKLSKRMNIHMQAAWTSSGKVRACEAPAAWITSILAFSSHNVLVFLPCCTC